jgi:serine/threonine protein kinase
MVTPYKAIVIDFTSAIKLSRGLPSSPIREATFLSAAPEILYSELNHSVCPQTDTYGLGFLTAKAFCGVFLDSPYDSNPISFKDPAYSAQTHSPEIDRDLLEIINTFGVSTGAYQLEIASYLSHQLSPQQSQLIHSLVVDCTKEKPRNRIIMTQYQEQLTKIFPFLADVQI